MTFQDVLRAIDGLMTWLERELRVFNAWKAARGKGEEPAPEPPAEGTPTSQELYDAHVTETRVMKARTPTIAEDRIWRKAQGLSVKEVAALRKENEDDLLHKAGPRPKTRT